MGRQFGIPRIDEFREQNDALRNAINGRKGWAWARNHGGYAQYTVSDPFRIAVVHVQRNEMGGDWKGKYDAEEVKDPFNDMIQYEVADANEIVKIVEAYFAK